MTFEKAEKYFNRYKYLYGNSYKYEFGKWSNHITCFTSWEEAAAWYFRDEYDFRIREFITKGEALKLIKMK